MLTVLGKRRTTVKKCFKGMWVEPLLWILLTLIQLYFGFNIHFRQLKRQETVWKTGYFTNTCPSAVSSNEADYGGREWGWEVRKCCAEISTKTTYSLMCVCRTFTELQPGSDVETKSRKRKRNNSELIKIRHEKFRDFRWVYFSTGSNKPYIFLSLLLCVHIQALNRL